MNKGLTVKNPYDGSPLGELAFATEKEISTALSAADECFRTFRHSRAFDRSQILRTAFTRLTAGRDQFAELISREAGKPIAFARVEVDRALNVLDWAAAEALRFSGEVLRTDTAAGGRWGLGVHQKFPRGVVLGITPFNFPLNLVMHKVAPAIAAGCPILIKPSPFTPLTALNCATLFEGAPRGLVQVLIASDADSARLTSAREVATISFTGSDRIGWMIRKQAPEKPTCLELGGNAWAVVMGDLPESSFAAVAKKLTTGAFGYAGQSCISVQNIAIESPIYDRFKKELVSATEAVVFGAPSAEGVVSGPVIQEASAKRIRAALEGVKGVQKFCSRAFKGTSTTDSIEQHSNVVPPTLVEFSALGAAPDTQSFVQTEIFGPVASVRKFEKLDHLIGQVNASPYGLQSGVYTQRYDVIERLYRELEVGGVVVNDIPSSRHDHQPYGGVKASGVGREGIRYAMEEMCESKFLSLSSTIV